ncbi:hypothetical protein RND81_09G168700 [Saponaria officinalis]|uniref:Uncharacterized protein n=1 Tax=Saponaria officinalis TaxID=3572 RepID=A0AAW1ILP4_SAPOF
MTPALPQFYSGTSTLALVARLSAFSSGLAYGNVKLKFLKRRQYRRCSGKEKMGRHVLDEGGNIEGAVEKGSTNNCTALHGIPTTTCLLHRLLLVCPIKLMIN